MYDRLNFFINKKIGAYYTPAQLDNVVDIASMSYFNDEYLKYSVSQRVTDSLSPFKRKFTFTNTTTPGGLINSPTDYFDAISIRVVVQDAHGNNLTRPVSRVNENEVAGYLNSQIYPPTLLDPICVTVQDWDLQLYPSVPMAGYMAYLKRPDAPKYVFDQTGRVLTYDPVASIQLEWADKDIQSIIIKALEYIGINMREQDIKEWADHEDQQNILSVDKA